MSRAAAFCVLLALLAGAPAGDAARGGRELLRPRGSEEGLRRELITEDNLFSHNSTKCRPDLVGRGNATFCDGVLVRWTALLASTQLEHRSSASAQRQRGEYPEGWPPTPPPAPSPPASTAPSTSPTTPSTTRSSPCRRRSHTGSTSPRARAAPTPSAGERRAVPSPPSEFPARTPTLADGPLSTLHKRRFQGLPTVGPRAPYNSGSLAPPGRVLARAPASFPHTHTHTPHTRQPIVLTSAPALPRPASSARHQGLRPLLRVQGAPAQLHAAVPPGHWLFCFLLHLGHDISCDLRAAPGHHLLLQGQDTAPPSPSFGISQRLGSMM